MLKNSLSKQYVELMKLTANFRVLLTGTVISQPTPLITAPSKQSDRTHLPPVIYFTYCLRKKQRRVEEYIQTQTIVHFDRGIRSTSVSTTNYPRKNNDDSVRLETSKNPRSKGF